MKKVILANWKANLSLPRAESWSETFAQFYRPQERIEIIIAVSPFMLDRIAQKIGSLQGISLAVQGISSYPQGSYTGSTPAAWVRGLAQYTLLGHSERRRYFHETVQDVARQVAESLSEELQPIICVDQKILTQQTAALAAEELEHALWAYTPDTPATFEMARSVSDIAAILPQFRQKTDNRPVLYGGGVTAENSAALWRVEGLGGVMLGKACLDAKNFASLVNSLSA
jgi:triosephosphate isomerase